MSDWDARYAEPEYLFGTEPNDFLREVTPLLPPGRALCLADGEGRNGVWLAQQGHAVTSVDLSQAGLAKATRLAAERGVTIEAVHADLETFAIEPGAWSVIVAIFVHLPPPLRVRVHRAAARGLAPGGMFVLEAYRPEQLAHGTGGPSDVEKLMDLKALRAELPGLDWVIARELERDVREGTRHVGRSAVVQLLARRAG